MVSIFYFIGFIISISLVSSLFKYKDIMLIKNKYNMSNSISDVNDRLKYIHMVVYGITLVLFLLWCFIGLLSSNWLVFMILIAIQLIIPKLINIIGGKNSISSIKIIMNMLLSIVISGSSLLIALNHFYLKYDLESIILGFLK